MDWPLVIFVSYGVLFVVACFGLAMWHAKRRRDKPPVAFKLVRGPGESLRRRVFKFDENLMEWLIGWGLVPIFALLTVSALWLFAYKPRTWVEFNCWLGFSGIVFGIALLISIRRVVRGLFRYRSDRLGYLGERFVAEKIAPLAREGFYIFHDVPAETGKRKFNLDHVVVGSTGLWLIETKTRRKGRARPGFAAHEVAYDGAQLIWPWGEDRHGLEQAEAEARWLSDWLQQRTGLDLTARPILALPGWMVKEQKLGPVRVLNPLNIPEAILGRRQQVLTEGEIDLLARQLEDRCRDVED